MAVDLLFRIDEQFLQFAIDLVKTLVAACGHLLEEFLVVNARADVLPRVLLVARFEADSEFLNEQLEV